MSPFPVQFADRWGGRRARVSYDDAVCWHLLLGGHAAVRTMAADVQQRLARFGGLHMTPPQWLHVTVLRTGTTEQVTRGDIGRMLASAQAALAETPPVTVRLERVLYHPEAIALGVSPSGVLAPVLAAARAAGPGSLGTDGREENWAPHLTLCYSTGEQPAAPVIAELGKALPACEVTVGAMSLVVQEGPERLWNWRIAGTVRLLGDSGHRTLTPGLPSRR
jgi:2'-5' RNA ligase